MSKKGSEYLLISQNISSTEWDKRIEVDFKIEVKLFSDV